MQKLYLVRHGQSQANADGILAGQNESPLTELGRAQAKAAGEAAKQLGIDTIVSSPMGRAQETAHIIADSIGYSASNIIIIEALKERFLGDRQGVPRRPLILNNQERAAFEAIHNVEPAGALLQRASEALATIQALPGRRILIVCHNGIGKALQMVCTRRKAEEYSLQPAIRNGVVIELEVT